MTLLALALMSWVLLSMPVAVVVGAFLRGPKESPWRVEVDAAPGGSFPLPAHPSGR
jgi:hypothetical protein